MRFKLSCHRGFAHAPGVPPRDEETSIQVLTAEIPTRNLQQEVESICNRVNLRYRTHLKATVIGHDTYLPI